MTTICKLIGGAGTGKTRYLMDVLAQWLERGENPFGIGFISFTRMARAEASSRAAQISGTPKSELEQYGWFRTVHSVAYKSLGIGKELLKDDKESRLWLAKALSADPEGLGASPDATDGLEAGEEPSGPREAASDESNALALWDVARSRMEPLEPVWDAAQGINEFLPDWDFVKATVERYEQAKRLDGRCDFTDLLGRFAGVWFDPARPPDLDGVPEGPAPDVRLWFLDEWQDASALLDRCARRMTDGAEVVYLAADPFQSIFSFGGSSPKHFFNWTASDGKEKTMPKSWRCPRDILALGETILRECTDYWDRKIEPRAEGGEIDVELFDGGWVDEIDPSQPWLLLARSNAHVRRLIKKLDAEGIPWMPTRGHGGKWAAPVRRNACLGLISLEHDHAISAAEWTAALKFLPSKTQAGEIITHGAKAEWTRQERKSDDLTDAEHLSEWGASPLLVDLIRSGRWASLIDNGVEFRDAWKRWGHQAVLEPQVFCGTIHSAKGSEKENVVLLTTTSRQCRRSMDFEETANEERRVAYVGVTRTRQRLVVLRERCLHQMDVPI